MKMWYKQRQPWFLSLDEFLIKLFFWQFFHANKKVIFGFWSHWFDYYRSPLASIIYSALELTDGPTCTENVRYNANVAAEKIRYLVSWNSLRPLDIGLREKSMKWWEPSILTKVTKNRQRKKKFFKNFWREYSKLKITKKKKSYWKKTKWKIR